MEIESTLPASAAPAADPPASAERTPMSPRTRAALGVGGAALALGVLGDALLRPTPWGVNAALWMLALVLAAAALQGWAETEDTDAGWIPLALGAAALLAWRDSPTLKALDLTAILVILGLAVHRARGGAVRLAGMAAYAGGLLTSFADAAFGAGALLGRDVKWREIPRTGWSRHALGVARGLAIAAPLLLLFGALLAAADAAFERLLTTTFNFDLPGAMGHVFLALLFAWGAAGVLRPLVLQTEPVGGKALRGAPALARPSLGILELATVLGLLDLLFLAFVAVQLPYFFGGAALVEAPGTPTYAQYARRGFFELVAVAGLVLPLLLGAHWLLRKESARHVRLFTVLAGAMVALVMVMNASALHRMRLYQAAYGLTELRLYTTAFMLWLTAVLGWFCWTVLRGRRERFAFGALTVGLETLVVLHAANPDALIVRVNVARRDAEVRFDARYAAGLSADAVPALLAALPKLEPLDRCLAAERLLARWDGEGEDWRSWSLGRGRALGVVEARERELRAMECGDAATPPPPARRPVEERAVVPVPVQPVAPSAGPSSAPVPPAAPSSTTAPVPVPAGR